jgi:hypothetical protein
MFKIACIIIIVRFGQINLCGRVGFGIGGYPGGTMRSEFGKTVEAARVTTGRYGSSPGQPFGSFQLTRLGKRFVVIASVELGWDHVSVSLRKRTPTWREMCWVKNLFFHPEETVVLFHPAVSRYVNDHKFCLHLWRPHDEFPEPFPLMVGLRPGNGDRPGTGW